VILAGSVRRVPDAAFAHPRLAAIYDAFDDDRSDLDVYEALVAELGARTVLDVGCGTGSLAVRLAGSGLRVVGVDPAGASLDVARGKPHAHRVRWVHGDAAALPTDLDETTDLAIMTGNVAQVFLTDDDLHATLTGVRRALRPGGLLVLETRVPERRAWEGWTTDDDHLRVVPGLGRVATRMTVTEVSPPLVTFRSVTTFLDAPLDDPERTLVSTSTLRFRSHDEVAAALTAAGFDVREVRDAPDRPGLEMVFVSTVTPAPPESSPPAS
jgi:ubiquinone/menaquinone biosynthesis C-methylase UbiE